MSSISVEPGALLTTTDAHVTLEALNVALQSYGLCLPIVPLECGLTLADLVQRNAGGRRQLRYGTIARYLRGATVQMPDAPHGDAQSLLTFGGPTLKRATGYALQRALVGGQSIAGLAVVLHDITLNIRPIPPARCVRLLRCQDVSAACQVAAALRSAGLALSALALIESSAVDMQTLARLRISRTGTLLLAELEGVDAVVSRQTKHLEQIATRAGATVMRVSEDAAWHPWNIWEMVAEAWRTHAARRLDLTVPSANIPAIQQQGNEIAWRYGVEMRLWGDAGVGRLHLAFATDSTRKSLTDGELAQVIALVATAAEQAGGARATECGQVGQGDPVPTLSRLIFGTSPSSSFLERLRGIVAPPYLITRPDDLLCYAKDASIARAEGSPTAAVLPASTSEVSAILRLAAEAGVSVVARGAGSGLAGGALAGEQSLLLVLTRMQRLSIDAARSIAVAEAGTTTIAIQQAAAAHGLVYPPDPSSQPVSTIGGNIACNAGGPRCLKYGVTGDYVLSLTAVLADGAIVRVGDGLTAQSADAGLLHLLVGSEGTLAVITEATLRLLPAPAMRRTVLAIFDQLDDACATVEAIMAAGLLPASLELLDDTTLRVVEAYLHLGLPTDVGALLLMLADGEPEAVEWETQILEQFARRGNARDVQVARSSSDEATLWRARRSISPALARVRPNKLGEDICVPVPQVAATVRRIKAIAERYTLPIPVFGHAGDGNLHPNILFDARDTAEAQRAWQAAEEIFLAALELGGTLSGEHGIGLLKRPFLEQALGADVLALHHAIKATFDPHRILRAMA